MFEEEVVIEIYEWYQSIEKRLLEITDVLPFVNESDLKKFQSPRLIPIMVETCSVVDTLLRSLMPAKFKRPTGREITNRGANIYDYFRELESELHLKSTKSLLLQGKPTILCPFENWSEDSNKPMPWWKIYNRLKHDRIKSSREANLLHCINALCALMQVMTKIPSIMALSLRVNWIQTAGNNPVTVISDVSKINKSKYVAYSELFATFLFPTSWDSPDVVRPVNILNSERLIGHLGRLATKAEHEI
jgi:hypothetical protein